MYSLELDDFRFSGPAVWPRISAERMSDLIIFKRPELTYLEARRKKEKLEAEDEEKLVHMLVTVYHLEYDTEKKRMSTSSRLRTSFWHFIRDDKTDDVTKLLIDLRKAFEKIMPAEPNPYVGVKIHFSCERKWKSPLAAFSSRWV